MFPRKQNYDKRQHNRGVTVCKYERYQKLTHNFSRVFSAITLEKMGSSQDSEAEHRLKEIEFEKSSL